MGEPVGEAATGRTHALPSSFRRLRADAWQLVGLWVVLGFLACFFLYPLVKVALLSLTTPAGGVSLQAFRALAADATVLRVLGQTVRTSLLVSLICLVIGYPAAYCLAKLTGWKSALVSALILFPFLSSSLVRTFVFIVLLGRRGTLNEALVAAGVPGAPFRLLFNETGVLIGMTYVLLPYMILSLVSGMKAIDRSLLKAAQSLGATRWTAHRLVWLPLSLPGVAAGTVITTILGFGYFVTPSLMGGPGQMMIAQLVEQQVSTTLNLAGAAALAVVMLLIVAGTYAAASRCLGLNRMIGAV